MLGTALKTIRSDLDVGHVKQPRAMSFVEAIANVIVGFLLAVATQLAVFPIFGIQASLSDTMQIGGVFTVVSILRSFMLRRMFEAIRSRRIRGVDGSL